MPLNINWQQILLHLLNFVILAGGLYLLLYKPVKKFMDNRTEKYRAMDEDTKRRLEEANALKAEHDELLKNADAEITALREKADREAKDSASRLVAEAEEESRRIIAEARSSAAAERDRIIGNAQQEVAEIAVSAAKKVLAESSGKAIDEFLDVAEKE